MQPLVRDVLHLVAWGQLGLLIRYYLGRVFGAACKPGGGSWVPCVTSPGLSRPGGTLFTDLPANILGSALMGLLSPADLLLMRPVALAAAPAQPQQASDANCSTVQAAAPPPPPSAVQAGVPMACWPKDSALQKHSALQLGLRTGLCGCLTTFASWLSQMVQMAVGTSPTARNAGTEWFQALCGLALGTLAAQAALNSGQQVAFMLAGHWHRRSMKARATAPVHAEERPMTVPTLQVVTNEHGAVASEDKAAAGAANGTELQHVSKDTSAVSGGDGNGKPGPAIPAQPVAAATAPQVGWWEAHACEAMDVVAVLVLLVLNAVSIALVAVVSTADVRSDAPGSVDFSLWVGILLGPIGCLARWRLAGLNTRPAADQQFPPAWFPFGTFLANMGGCLIDYVMLVLQLKVPALGPDSNGVLTAVMLGVGGSLSTVSTWVVELQKLGYQAQINQRATWYLLSSLVVAMSLGFLVYGTVAWKL